MGVLEVLYALHESDGLIYLDKSLIKEDTICDLKGIVIFESGKAYWDC